MTTSTTRTGARAPDSQPVATASPEPIKARPPTHAELITQANGHAEDLEPIGWGHPIMLTALIALAALFAFVYLLVGILLKA